MYATRLNNQLEDKRMMPTMNPKIVAAMHPVIETNKVFKTPTK